MHDTGDAVGEGLVHHMPVCIAAPLALAQKMQKIRRDYRNTLACRPVSLPSCRSCHIPLPCPHVVAATLLHWLAKRCSCWRSLLPVEGDLQFPHGKKYDKHREGAHCDYRRNAHSHFKGADENPPVTFVWDRRKSARRAGVDQHGWRVRGKNARGRKLKTLRAGPAAGDSPQPSARAGEP